MPKFSHILLYTDGSSRGNPGAGSIGIIICDENNKKLCEYSEFIGYCTNNEAEYKALIKGLELAVKYTRKKVTVYSDSELVIKQLNGIYRIKSNNLLKLFLEVKQREKFFKEIVYQYVPRGNQRIKEADRLNKQAYAGRPVNRYFVTP